MRHLFLYPTILFVLILCTYAPGVYPQNPTFSMTLVNGKQVSSKVFEVDIYMQSTSTTIELATFSLGISFNNAIVGRGKLTPSWVSSSSQLTNQTELPTALSTATAGVIKIAGKIPPGAGSGSIISNIAPGTKIGRLRLTNSQRFASGKQMNFTWLAASPYPTTVNAYVAKINTNITSTGTYNNYQQVTSRDADPASLVSKVQGQSIILNWSSDGQPDNDIEVQRADINSKTTEPIWNTLSLVKASDMGDAKDITYSDKQIQSGKYQYRLKITEADGSITFSNVVESEIAELPKSFSISQNYPNPFNPTTKIDYQVPADARVILEVYNIAGQKVAELVNKEQSAGFYTVNFGGAGKLASGVYIYKMTAIDKATGNNFSAIKKMMLLK
jgi:hypothetical protein